MGAGVGDDINLLAKQSTAAGWAEVPELTRPGKTVLTRDAHGRTYQATVAHVEGAIVVTLWPPARK